MTDAARPSASRSPTHSTSRRSRRSARCRRVWSSTSRSGTAGRRRRDRQRPDQGLIGSDLPSDLRPHRSSAGSRSSPAGAEFIIDGYGAPWPAGVTLTNARGCYAGAIAQFTLAAILRVAERADARTELQQGGVWPEDNDAFIGKLLRGQTLVIVGYGGIGREIARLASAFGMRIIAVKARPEQHADTSFRLPGTGDPEGTIPDRIVGVDGLGDAFAEADFVSITLPISSGSRGVVSRAVLERLRPHAWLINTGRGPVTDEEALAELLAAGRIGGAALDVFGQEPLPSSSPFWTLPDVVLTPHISGSSGALEHRHLIAENLRRFVAGEALMNEVDVERGTDDDHPRRSGDRAGRGLRRPPQAGPADGTLDRVLQRARPRAGEDQRHRRTSRLGRDLLVPGLPEMLREVGRVLVGRSAAALKPLVRDIRWSLEHPYAVSALVIALETSAPDSSACRSREYGGGTRTKVRAYAASGGYVEGGDPADTWPEESPGRERVHGAQAAARAVPIATRRRWSSSSGPDCAEIDLMADGNAAYTFPRAIEMGRGLERLGFRWWEEPIKQGTLRGLRADGGALDLRPGGRRGMPSAASCVEYLLKARSTSSSRSRRSAAASARRVDGRLARLYRVAVHPAHVGVAR